MKNGLWAKYGLGLMLALGLCASVLCFIDYALGDKSASIGAALFLCWSSTSAVGLIRVFSE